MYIYRNYIYNLHDPTTIVFRTTSPNYCWIKRMFFGCYCPLDSSDLFFFILFGVETFCYISRHNGLSLYYHFLDLKFSTYKFLYL